MVFRQVWHDWTPIHPRGWGSVCYSSSHHTWHWHYYYGSTALCWALATWSYTQSLGLLGWGAWHWHSRRNSALICGGQRRIFMRKFTRSMKMQGITWHPTYSLCCRGGHQLSTHRPCRSNARRNWWD